jgi:CRP-like cAMP-binding protein
MDSQLTHSYRRTSDSFPRGLVTSDAGLIKKLLNKAAEFRTAADLSLIEAMLVEIDFFKDLKAQTDAATLKECATWVKQEAFKQGDYVFRQGDRGTKFYIILQGSVTVYDELAEEGEAVALTHYVPGQSFGELALLQDKPRAASVMCEQDCDFAVFDKGVYRRVIGKLEDRRLNARIDFLSKLPVFAAWTRHYLGKLTYYFQDLNFPRKKLVFEDGTPPSYVYIVFSGEFSLFSRVDSPSIGRQLSVRAKTRKLRAPVALLGEGEFIGYENAISGLPLTCSCRCSSTQGVLWTIKRHDFLKRVVRSQQQGSSIAASRAAGRAKRAQDFQALKLEKFTPVTQAQRPQATPSPVPYRPYTRGHSTSRLKTQNLLQLQRTLSKIEGMSMLQLFETKQSPIKRTMSNLKQRPELGLALKKSLNRTASMTHKKIKSVPNFHMQALRQELELRQMSVLLTDEYNEPINSPV